MDAVHKRNEEEGSTSAPPRREDITDTMIFSPSDLVTMICRDVDLNYATRGMKMHVCRGSSQGRLWVSAIWLKECKRGASSFSLNGCRCNGETISDLSTLFWSLLAFDFSDTFTDTAISSSRINGEHKEKVLQRWDGGDSNGESYDLETDTVGFIHSVKFLCIQRVTYC